MLFVGIDISKVSFDVAILFQDKYKNKLFENTEKGFKAFSSFLKKQKQTAICCMEATGTYGLPLAKHLYNNDCKVIEGWPVFV